MKKLVSVLIILALLAQRIYAYEPIDDSMTAVDRLAAVNKQVSEIYGLPLNRITFPLNTAKGSINQSALMTTEQDNIQLFYGTPPVDQYFWNGKIQNRLLGYSYDGGEYDNQNFPWDAGWSGTQIQDFNFIKEPWDVPKTLLKGAKDNTFNGNPILEQNILDGLNTVYEGVVGADRVPANILNPSYANRLVYTTNSKPSKGGDWVDYVYIEQPPTYDSWGYGRVWIDHPSTGSITYLSIRLAPFKKQINAVCTITAPPTVAHDEASVAGTFNFTLTSLQPLTKYEIIDVKNATINGPTTKSISGTSYSGSVPITINIPGSTVTTEITIKATNNIGLQGFATATAIITKNSPPASFDTTGTTGTLTVQSMPRGGGEFDATKGIPTGEDLYVEVIANNYIAGYDSSTYLGTRTYTVTVSGNYVSALGVKTPFSQNVYVTRNYAFSNVSSYYVYQIKQAKISNYALPSGILTLTPSEGYNITSNVTEGGVTSEPSNTTLAVGDLPAGTSLQAYAEAQIGDITTSDDILYINGASVYAGNALPEPTKISNTELYKDTITINKTLANQNGTASTAIVTYELAYDYGGSGKPSTLDVNISGNKVTVHTPVVCEGGILSDSSFNQEITPDNTKATLVLGRASQFRLLTTGQHKNIQGYGNRDYEAYTSKKQVRFPIDIYLNTTIADNTKFLPAHTWCDVPLNQDEVAIYVPTWVSEGDYTLEYRALAVNAPNTTGTEKTANLDLVHYVATDSSPIRVVGRLYGFKITDLENYPLWEPVFRTSDDTDNHTGTYFYPGLNNQNGVPSGVTQQFTLPILAGSHPTVKNQVLPTGYSFKFELDTVGNYWGDQDCINITPTFYYVNKEGTNRQQVDLWYSEYFNGKDHYFVQVGSAQDDLNVQYIELGDPLRNVPAQAIKDTSALLGITENYFKTQKAKLGWLDRIVLAKPLRTFVGNTALLPTSVNPTAALKSIQHWYGEYHLPNNTYVAPKGFDVLNYARTHNGLDGTEAFWLKDGYIIVNLDIVTVKGGDFDHPVLRYGNAVNANMWGIEGYKTTKTDYFNVTFNLQNGDIIFYNTDQKASDDYNTGGTH